MAIINFRRKSNETKEENLPQEPTPLTPNNPDQIFSVRQHRVYQAIEEALTSEDFQDRVIFEILPQIHDFDPGDYQPWETEHWESFMETLLGASINWIVRNVER